MSDFSTGHARARGLKGLAVDTWNMFKPTVEEERLGTAMIGGKPVNAKDAVVGGIWAGIGALPFGKTISGASKTVGNVLRKQVADTFKTTLVKMGKKNITKKHVTNIRNTEKILKLVPDVGLNAIDSFITVDKLPRTKIGAENPIGRNKYIGGGKSQILRTNELKGEDVPHELGHAAELFFANESINAKHVRNSQLIKEARRLMLDSVAKKQKKYDDFYGKGTRFSIYKRADPSEILAKKFNTEFNKATLGGKKALTDDEYIKVYEKSLMHSVYRLYKEAPKIYRTAAKKWNEKFHIVDNNIQYKDIRSVFKDMTAYDVGR